MPITMNVTELAAFIQAATILVTFGRVAVEQVRAMFAVHGLTDAELNIICDAVNADATRRKALADAESGR